ncbi:ornithine cyclodeaminase [Pedobacter lusitanus]|uniref:Ornithine cyclodeaminase n=1 Tax=Pedobacter lusitanus TaxID=1503925 RepID=A0A0D0GFK1_9SPHI|nr:ornithine cyclodeaminase [Pedobacter lusitanus]KIO74910.1 ornithine cyclodeaminase [Pedobacter lusitanus]
MLYLNKKDLKEIGIVWQELVGVIKKSVQILQEQDFAQPIKPYLRYHDIKNRIIAMPAFIGGEINFAGIKWIASFPGNFKLDIPRAHSITILNEANTGRPICTINTTLISGLRTAAVSGLILNEFLSIKRSNHLQFTLSIVGLGPIGKLHLEMASTLLSGKLKAIKLHDVDSEAFNALSDLDFYHDIKDKLIFCKTWEEAYDDADIFITCTVSNQTYINKEPKKGSLHLNVSLRDYMPEFIHYANHIIVDNWEEVCRENTDIENMHKKYALAKEDTSSIIDVVCNHVSHSWKESDIVMFNPMGMAVFDIAIGGLFYNKAIKQGKGQMLEA